MHLRLSDANKRTYLPTYLLTYLLPRCTGVVKIYAVTILSISKLSKLMNEPRHTTDEENYMRPRNSAELSEHLMDKRQIMAKLNNYNV